MLGRIFGRTFGRGLSRAFSEAVPTEEPVNFVERDFHEMKKIEVRLQYDSAYLKLMDKWQRPLEKKALRKARIARLKAAFVDSFDQVPPAEQEEKLVVHQPLLPVDLYPRDEELFAVVNINGFQYKVVKDDVVLANYLQGYDINDQVVFDGVLLVGGKDFTLLGRPLVRCAKVYATVEEQTNTEKTIVFKKKRRKTYQKTMHFRHLITVLRIDKIEYQVQPDLLRRAVGL